MVKYKTIHNVCWQSKSFLGWSLGKWLWRSFRCLTKLAWVTKHLNNSHSSCISSISQVGLVRARVHSLRSDEVKCLCAETKNAAHASCFNNVLTTAAVWTLTLCGLLFIWHQSEEDVGGWHDPWILSSRPGKKKNELWRRHHAFLKSWQIFNVMRSGRLRKISDALRKNCHSHSILCGINFKKDTDVHTQKKKHYVDNRP